MKIGIFGYGGTGQATAKFYKNPLIKDLNRGDGLHIDQFRNNFEFKGRKLLLIEIL